MARSVRGLILPRRGGATRRKTDWQEGPGGSAQTTITGTGKTILGSGFVLLADGNTLVRTRGHVLHYLESSAAISDGFNGAFGIGIVTAQAFAIGVTAMPGPVAELDWDGWLFHQFYTIRGLFVTTPGQSQGPAFIRFDVDSKAMRKVDENEVIFAMYEGTESGTVTSRIDFDSRILFKLP